jgi:hypothetical protein
MNDEENIIDSGQIRRKCIIEYVKNNPECEKEDVISYCTKIGEGSRVTLSKSINDLIKDGILNEGKEKKNSKSYKLTIASENLLLIIPKDLEDIFTELKLFIKIIKKRIGNGVTLSNEPLENRITKRFEYESKQSFLFLPYYVMEIINNLYTFYFNFVSPKKIENKNTVIKLYSSYFNNLSEAYYYILEELGNAIANSNYNPTSIRSKMYKGHFESEQPELFPIYRTARMCRINGVEKELYSILNILWKRNEDTCKLLYGLDLDIQIQEKHYTFNRKNDNLFEDKDTSEIQDNKTLKKIHFFIDDYIHQQEKGEEEAERGEYDDMYNPFD